MPPSSRKIRKCSQCWLPREEKSDLCKKCVALAQEKTFSDALIAIFKKAPLDRPSLEAILTPKQLSQLLLNALAKGHPFASVLKERKPGYWGHVLREIRFHKEPHSTTCQALRRLLDQDLFHEIVIPEECLECMYSCVTKAYADYSNLAIGHLFYSDKDKLTTIFERHLRTKGGRESLLNYINFMLWISNSQEYMTPTASKRVIDVLTEAVHVHHPSNKQWILEELVQRPENWQFFLSSPSMIPGNYTETMFDTFTDFEVWWNFWQRVNTSVRKKLEFRYLALKDELLAVAWDVERVRDWCLDIEDLTHVNRFFARRVANQV
jgi:hypothetical protein